ncbi:right-handed parallel beta-helix repeat-containing protein [Patescibacteria group bacterium]
MQAGDVVNLREGTYSTSSDKIEPKNNGNSQGYIVYQAYGEETPILTQRLFINKSYLRIKGIKFIPQATSFSVKGVLGTHHVEILNSEFILDYDASRALYIQGDYYTVKDCFFKNGYGDMFLVEGAYALIENNDFSQAGSDHSVLAIKGGHTANVVVRGNYFRNPWDRAFIALKIEGTDTKNILIEGNVFVDNLWDRVGTHPFPDDAENGGVEAIRISVPYGIFRNNLIVGTNIGKGTNSCTAFQTRIFPETSGDRLWFEHNRLYHNTFFQNQPNSIAFRRTAPSGFTQDNIFKNNLIADSGVYSIFVEDTGFDYNFVNNLISHNPDFSSQSKTLYLADATDGEKVINLPTAESRYPDRFANNVTGFPEFVNESILVQAKSNPSSFGMANFDDLMCGFALNESSPGKNQAQSLTQVTSSVSGSTTINVEDALYFFDGYDFLQGDKVIIGSNEPVGVLNVVGDSVLEIDRPITASAGDGVYLEASGRSPDMGVYECFSSVPVPNPLCRGDVTNPATIDSADFRQALADWGGPPTLTENDINLDWKVNSLDLTWVIKGWGPACQ